MQHAIVSKSVAFQMFVIFPSDNEMGTLSTLASDFETARYYTVASIISDTLADTKIKQGFPSPPPGGEWGPLLKRLKIDLVVASAMQDGTAASIASAGIRVVKGAKGLVGDLVDWIADVGVDEFAEKVELLNKPPPEAQEAGKAPQQKVEPVVKKDGGGETPVAKSTGQGGS